MKVRGVWLNIGIDKSEFISIAAKAGSNILLRFIGADYLILHTDFVFHHAKPDYVLMTHWLSDEPNHLPHYASHYIGVGGTNQSHFR